MYLDNPSQIKLLSKRLSINLETIPDITFTKEREYLDATGKAISVYIKRLENPCLALFDLIECTGDNYYRMICFECKNINDVNFRRFIDIVNGFGIHNKIDTEGRGRISKIEEDFLRTDNFITREWIDCRYPISLEFNRNTGFSMIVDVFYNEYVSDEELEKLEG